jgi:hypothetical protein
MVPNYRRNITAITLTGIKKAVGNVAAIYQATGFEYGKISQPE